MEVPKKDRINLAAGDYEVTVTDTNGCSDVEFIQVLQTGIPVISANSTRIICNEDENLGSVQFQVFGGAPPYQANGVEGAFDGNLFISEQVENGAELNIIITDSQGCQSEGTILLVNCACISFAGQMNVEEILSGCGNQTVTADTTQGAILDGDDVLTYILHDNPTPTIGTIFARNMVPEFQFTTGMEYGEIYYISPAVGNEGLQGFVDLNDPCLSVASGQPVRFAEGVQDPIQIQVTDSLLCPGAALELLTDDKGPGVQYIWSTPLGDTLTTIPLLFIDSFQVVNQGLYTVSTIAGNCISDPFPSPINIQLEPEIGDISAGDDTILCGVDTITLQGTMPDFANGIWTVNTGAAIFKSNLTYCFG